MAEELSLTYAQDVYGDKNHAGFNVFIVPLRPGRRD
jgi:hypothetical protein